MGSLREFRSKLYRNSPGFGVDFETSYGSVLKLGMASIRTTLRPAVLEIRQGLADDGLRRPQLATGGGKAALLRCGDEGAKLIHGASNMIYLRIR